MSIIKVTDTFTRPLLIYIPRTQTRTLTFSKKVGMSRSQINNKADAYLLTYGYTPKSVPNLNDTHDSNIMIRIIPPYSMIICDYSIGTI